MIHEKLKALYEDLLKDGAKNKTIAKKYNVSPSEISILKTEVEMAIKKHRKRDALVDVPQPDRAIAIDETFLNIEGKKVYVIIATGYTSRKVLGIKVSFSDFESNSGLKYARKIRLVDPKTETILALKLKQTVFNKILPESIFKLEKPKGFEMIPLR